eukprot:scaffold30026_cov53-Attheya_sp.AAC.6
MGRGGAAGRGKGKKIEAEVSCEMDAAAHDVDRRVQEEKKWREAVEAEILLPVPIGIVPAMEATMIAETPDIGTACANV